jgi:outer membrane protein OmpA-like peptidoglycan-associated protein
MALLTSLFSMLDKRNVSGIANALGETEPSVLQGMQSSIAAILGGMASKSDDANAMRKILDLAPKGSGDAIWSQMTRGASDPSSSLMSTGKWMLSNLFGDSQGSITNALTTVSGLNAGVTSTLMTMVAPMVMSFLSKRASDEKMSMSSLANLLNSEKPVIQNALPAGMSDLFWPHTTRTTASPVVAQVVEKEKSITSWLVPLALLALIPCLWWFFSHARRPMPAQIKPVAVIPVPTGAANRVAPNLGGMAKPAITENVDLRFATGSSKLMLASQERLNKIAADLLANPDVPVRVAGYTDNTGGAQQNRQLSQSRANSVMAELVRKGVSPNRITVEGYGEENPIADNATAAGRALNRRVSVTATGVPQE